MLVVFAMNLPSSPTQPEGDNIAAAQRSRPRAFMEGSASSRFDMEWAKPANPRNQVDRAGVTVITKKPIKPVSLDELFAYQDAVDVINNWRSAHSYPLNCFQTNLRQRARKIDSVALVSQRLKRFESIVKKLERDQTSTLQLSQMQDIGGCRAVLSSTAEVYRLAKAYQKGPTRKWLHTLVGNGKDYIAHPKPDGYRSIHLIFKYVGTSPNHSWDKLRIEMQIRSQKQHAWATALEAVDIFTNQALKANSGNPRWQRFFALMGSAIAVSENHPRVPGTPISDIDLRAEIIELVDELRVFDTLEYYRHAIKEVSTQAASGKMAYYLLHLNFTESKISWQAFFWNESQKANQRYTDLEQSITGKSGELVVLVKATSFAAMKRAYPSFFLDTELFLRLVRDAIGRVLLEDL